MEYETKKIILANPKSFSRAFSFLVRKIAQIIEPKDANYAAYQELASCEMPPDFLTWYYTPSSDVPKFKKFEMFRTTHKISAMDVMKTNSTMHHDPLESRPRSASPKSKSKSKSNGGRKRRTRTQMRSRVRRQKRRTNRRR